MKDKNDKEIFVGNLEAAFANLNKNLEKIADKQISRGRTMIMRDGADDEEMMEILRDLKKRNNLGIEDIKKAVSYLPKEFADVKTKLGNLLSRKIDLDGTSVKVEEADAIIEAISQATKAIKAKEMKTEVNMDTEALVEKLERILGVVQAMRFPETFQLTETQMEALKPYENFATKEGQEQIIEVLQELKTVGGSSSGGAYPIVGLKDENEKRITPLAAATSVTVYNVTMASADTEYSFDLPENTKDFFIKLRSQNRLLKLSFIEGESGSTYFTIPQNGWSPSQVGLNLTDKTIYFQTDGDSQVAEIMIFT